MQVLALEEVSLNAWPAAHTLCYDGWLLRLTDGYTRRANSIQPLFASSLEIPAKIAHCEQVYTARGLDTIYKVTPVTQPQDLDARLEAMGYTREAITWVQLLQLPANASPGAGACTLDAGLTDLWLATYARLSRADPRHLPPMRRLLSSIVPEHRFAAMDEHGQTIAVSLVVLERGYAGIFDVVVDPSHRRRGVGINLVRHLLRWAQKHGAHHAYLQVVEDNVPARRLYANLGFRDAYFYWYRVSKMTSPSS